MELKFLSELDKDVLDNIDPSTVAILVDSSNYWIEILENGSFYVSDGWMGFTTTNFLEAYQFYKGVKANN